MIEDRPNICCGRCESSLESGDLRCAVCGEVVPEVSEAMTFEHVEVKVLRCQDCGAAIEYSTASQSPKCGFCGATAEVETVQDPLEQSEARLEFLVDSDQARRALRAWLGKRGFFAPGDLRREARLQKIRTIWFAAWVFDAEAEVSWAADSNQGARAAAWAPHSGEESLLFSEVVVGASRGLSDKEVDRLASSFDLKKLVSEHSEQDSSVLIERFEVQRSVARSKIRMALNRLAAIRIERRHVPGSKVRKVKVEALVRKLDTRRLLFPAYILAYRYRGEPYRVVISGQNSKFVVGHSPISWLRVVAVVLATAVGLATLAVGFLGA